MPDCPLCLVGQGLPSARRTAWHHEDETLVVLDCESCGVPMLVFRNHGPRSTAEHAHAMAVAGRLGLSVTRRTWKKCPGHEHWHAAWCGERGD